MIHENRGLNPHIKDVARRMALEGFLAFAVDCAVAGSGGTPADEDKAREMIGALEPAETDRAHAAAAVRVPGAGTRESTGKVGAVGFCWGGGDGRTGWPRPRRTSQAGVPYYGTHAPPRRTCRRSRLPLLLQYAGHRRAHQLPGSPAYRGGAEAARQDATRCIVYDGAQHAFNNDTNPARYNKAAADLAWSRTIAFLKKQLAG